MITAPYKSYTIIIEGDSAPINPDKTPRELLNDKRVKFTAQDATGFNIGTADRFCYKRTGHLAVPSLACPFTNLQRMIESIENPIKQVVAAEA